MNRIAFLLILSATFLTTACSTTEEKATMESANQAVADSILNAAPPDSAAVPTELSPEAEEKH